MHWQEACLKSGRNKAVRRALDGRRVERYADGSAYIKVRNTFKVRRASPSECEGFMDWEPA